MVTFEDEKREAIEIAQAKKDNNLELAQAYVLWLCESIYYLKEQVAYGHNADDVQRLEELKELYRIYLSNL